MKLPSNGASFLIFSAATCWKCGGGSINLLFSRCYKFRTVSLARCFSWLSYSLFPEEVLSHLHLQFSMVGVTAGAGERQISPCLVSTPNYLHSSATSPMHVVRSHVESDRICSTFSENITIINVIRYTSYYISLLTHDCFYSTNFHSRIN